MPDDRRRFPHQPRRTRPHAASAKLRRRVRGRRSLYAFGSSKAARRSAAPTRLPLEWSEAAHFAARSLGGRCLKPCGRSRHSPHASLDKTVLSSPRPVWAPVLPIGQDQRDGLPHPLGRRARQKSGPASPAFALCTMLFPSGGPHWLGIPRERHHKRKRKSRLPARSRLNYQARGTPGMRGRAGVHRRTHSRRLQWRSTSSRRPAADPLTSQKLRPEDYAAVCVSAAVDRMAGSSAQVCAQAVLPRVSSDLAQTRSCPSSRAQRRSTGTSFRHVIRNGGAP